VGGLIVQEQHTYPYGAPLTGLSYTVGTRRYRHGYQGQYAETDTTTGWESFELRLYDATRARWFAPDPEGQYASPYIAMGNNPVSRVDPDGGYVPSSFVKYGSAAAVGFVGGAVAGGISTGTTQGAFLGGLGGAAATLGGYAGIKAGGLRVGLQASTVATSGARAAGVGDVEPPQTSQAVGATAAVPLALVAPTFLTPIGKRLLRPNSQCTTWSFRG
jgi:RHS repeat-associated protein